MYIYPLPGGASDPRLPISRTRTRRGPSVSCASGFWDFSLPHPVTISVVICRIVIFSPRLFVMALLAQRLPVASIPEELRITSVWNDVVHNGSRSRNAFLQTLLTQRMKLQELLALPSPPRIVSSRCCRPDLLRVQCLMHLAILLPCWHEVRTTRMPAGDLWFVWHLHHLLFP
jgi:hypothetical protein